MCEIILVWSLGKMIAEQAAAKNRAGWPYVILLIVLWIVGEIFGLIMGASLTNGKDRLIMAGMGLGGGVIGGVIAFSVLAVIPAAEKRGRGRYDDDDDDYDDRPRRRSSRRDDDDDRPRHSSRRDDDDDWPKDAGGKYHQR